MYMYILPDCLLDRLGDGVYLFCSLPVLKKKPISPISGQYVRMYIYLGKVVKVGKVRLR